MANETNYIVSSLPAYVKNNAELISKQIVFGTPTIKRLTIQGGVKKDAYLNFLGVNVPIQSGLGCATGYDGTATFTQRTISTAIMEKKIKVCPDTLIGKWPGYETRIPADKRDVLPFEAYLVNELIGETGDQLETLLWQGKTTTYSGTDLINGFLTLVNAEATANKINVAAGTSAWNAVKAVIAALPTKLLAKSPKVFVAPEFFIKLAFELVEANLYHFDPGAPVESLVFPGTNIEVINTLGLANSSKIFASVLENMYYGTDEEDAEKRVKIVYNDENDYFGVKFRWNSGVQVAFPDWCVLATLQGNIVSPDANAELKSIATDIAAIKTSQASVATAAGSIAGCVNENSQLETHANS